MFGDNSWREARVADPPHMLLAQALAPQHQQLSPRSAGNQLWPSLDDAPLSKDMLRLHSALQGNPIKYDTGVQSVGITSCVLTAVQVVEIYSLLLDQTSVGSLALKYNVARTTINNIKNHTRWQVTTKHLWSNEDREAYDRTPKTLRGQKSVPWTEDEDNTLMIAVDQYGSRGMWTMIAKFLPERRPAQVHRRWKNHLQKSL